MGNLLGLRGIVGLTLVLSTAWLPAQASNPVTFAEHIAPLVYANCTRCHRPGEAAPFALLTYHDVRKRASNLLAVMEDRLMPPWHPAKGYGRFRNEARLSDAQLATFRAWVATGMPEGDASKTPKPPQFAAGWQLGEPDLILQTSGAFPVPAKGRDIYRNFSLPGNQTEDRWLRAVEIRAGSRSVLHHALLFLDENREMRAQEGRDGRPGFSGMREQRGALLAGWAVGGTPEFLPDDFALLWPKGSDLVLQSHLHPSGKAEQEHTTIGLYFAKEPPKRSLAAIQLPPFFGFTAGLDIPANEADYLLQDQFELPCEVVAVRVGGHAHMLGKSLKMWAVNKEGAEIPLLWIPRWDFAWQTEYLFAELVTLPKGAVLHSQIRYDNSSKNENNPNHPPKRVRWGRETTDEMGSITLLVSPANEADRDLLQQAIAKKSFARAIARAEEAVEQQFDGYDKDRDGELTNAELPRRLQPFFGMLDKDGNGKLSRAEARDIAELVQRLGRGFGQPPSKRGS